MKKSDIRVAKTNKAICEAFISQMKKIGFQKITVSSLVREAGICRNTFYLHYCDKYELLDSLENEFVDGLPAILCKMPISDLQEYGLDAAGPYALLRSVYIYINEQKNLFAVLASSGDNRLLNKMETVIKDVMLHHGFDYKSKVHPRYLSAISVGIQMGILREWLHSGMNESPEELADMMAIIFRNSPQSVLSGQSS